MNVLSELDHPKMAEEWKILTTQRAKRNFELRLRKPWFNEETGQNEQKWILASCDQEFDERGNLKTIMGCMFGIPHIVLKRQLTVAEPISVHRNGLKAWPRISSRLNIRSLSTRKIFSKWLNWLLVVRFDNTISRFCLMVTRHVHIYPRWNDYLG